MRFRELPTITRFKVWFCDQQNRNPSIQQRNRAQGLSKDLEHDPLTLRNVEHFYDVLVSIADCIIALILREMIPFLSFSRFAIFVALALSCVEFPMKYGSPMSAVFVIFVLLSQLADSGIWDVLLLRFQQTLVQRWRIWRCRDHCSVSRQFLKKSCCQRVFMLASHRMWRKRSFLRRQMRAALRAHCFALEAMAQHVSDVFSRASVVTIWFSLVCMCSSAWATRENLPAHRASASSFESVCAAGDFFEPAPFSLSVCASVAHSFNSSSHILSVCADPMHVVVVVEPLWWLYRVALVGVLLERSWTLVLAGLCLIGSGFTGHVLRAAVCFRCLRCLRGGGKRGRPVGAKNKTHGEATRASKRVKLSPDSYAEPLVESLRRTATKRERMRERRKPANAATRRAPRGHTAVRRARKGTSKDTKRAARSLRRKQLRAEKARAMRDAVAGLVLDTLSQQQLKQLTLVAFYTLLSNATFTRKSAASLAADIHGVHTETVLLWARTLEASLVMDGPSCGTDDAQLAEALVKCEAFWESLRGRHAKTLWLLADADKAEEAKVWVRAHLRVKGEGCMAVADFADYLNETLLADEVEERGRPISNTTAKVYLHRLGFETGNSRKGIDAVVHEREDVVRQRKAYLAAVDAELVRAKQRGGQPVVFLMHDECCFMAFDSQSAQWFEVGDIPTEKKRTNKGKGLMRSEFLTREKGLLVGASLELDYGRDGYFDSPKFLQQVPV